VTLSSEDDTLRSYLVVLLEKAGLRSPGLTVKLASWASSVIEAVSAQPEAPKANITTRMAAE
jgi:hypothetical protein